MDYYDPRRRALRAVRQLLYPRECPFCGRVLGDVRDCPDCAEQLEALRRKPGIRLDPAQHYISNLAGAAAPYRYSGCVRRGILNTKYQAQAVAGCGDGQPSGAAGLWRRTDRTSTASCSRSRCRGQLSGTTCIVPVPASGAKRGYNVPELMALPLAKAMEVPLAPQALERTRAKRHQAGLPLEQRMANVAGAFRAAQPQQVEGKRILLVDDVITTGTTAAACAQALLHAGCRQRVRAGLCHGRVWRTAGHYPDLRG